MSIPTYVCQNVSFFVDSSNRVARNCVFPCFCKNRFYRHFIVISRKYYVKTQVSFRLSIYSTNAFKWDVTQLYLIKLFLASNDKNGNGTRSCKFGNLKVALLVLLEIFLYYSKNTNKSKLCFLLEWMQFLTGFIVVIW